MSRWEDSAFLRRESARYLGMRTAAGEPGTRALIDDALDVLRAAAAPRHVAQAFPLSFPAPGVCEAAGVRIDSRSLEKSLSGCGQVLFFAATLGAPVDLCIARAEIRHIARAAVMQACAAALIEAYCDDVCRTMDERARAHGYWLRPRFSPGYGDLALAFQRPLLDVLDAPARIGLTLTDALVMAPVKSVSAFIGVSTLADASGAPDGASSACTACPQSSSCPYRRV